MPLHSTNTSIWQFIHSIYFCAHQWQCYMYGSIEISGCRHSTYVLPLHAFFLSFVTENYRYIMHQHQHQRRHEFRAKGRQSDIRTIWNFRNFHLKFIQTKVVGALHTHRTCVQLKLTRWCKRCARLLCMPNNLAERLKFFFLSQVFIIQASLHFRFRLSSVQLMYEYILYLNCTIESIRFTKYHHSTYSQQPN